MPLEQGASREDGSKRAVSSPGGHLEEAAALCGEEFWRRGGIGRSLGQGGAWGQGWGLGAGRVLEGSGGRSKVSELGSTAGPRKPETPLWPTPQAVSRASECQEDRGLILLAVTTWPFTQQVCSEQYGAHRRQESRLF